MVIIHRFSTEANSLPSFEFVVYSVYFHSIHLSVSNMPFKLITWPLTKQMTNFQYVDMYEMKYCLWRTTLLKNRVSQDGPSLESSSYLNVTLRYLGPWVLGTLGPWDSWNSSLLHHLLILPRNSSYPGQKLDNNPNAHWK